MKFFIAIFFLIFNTAYTQSSGKVTYQFSVPLILEGVATQDTKNFISNMVDYANKQQFELIFNGSNSKFSYIETLNFDSEFDRKINNIARTAFTSPDSYTDLNQKKQFTVMNDGTLIENSIGTVKWEITTETKKIGEYLAYKAILRIPFTNRNNELKERLVISWFAPSIPYSFGPKNFSGLPGLILELNEDQKTFIASKIELFENEIKVEFPRGKAISKEEYNRRLESSMGGVIISKKREEAKEKN